MRSVAWAIDITLVLACSEIHVSASPQSRYIRRDQGNRGVIVFVHGLTGDSTATWTNDQSKVYWPQLLTRDAEFNGFDIYVYEYPSPVRSTAYSPAEVADNMHLMFQNDGVL
jgi:pimeloyl-ACP methyl ester carboxylesterase